MSAPPCEWGLPAPRAGEPHGCPSPSPPPQDVQGRRGQFRDSGRITLLHLFSGPKGLSEGMLGQLQERGGEGREVDKAYGSPEEDDLASGPLFHELRESCEGGSYDHVHAGVPCETQSCAHDDILRPRRDPDGPPPELEGARLAAALAAVEESDLLRQRALQLALLVFLAGGTFSFEQPADRGDPHLTFFWDAVGGQRASMAQMPDVKAFIVATGAVWIYAPH